jgi:hypothetical protein
MLAQRTAKRQVAQSMSLPAPIGGLNARDSVALMPETDAITLDNWFPTTTSVDLRKGHDVYASFAGDCETIIAYNGLTRRLFVAANYTTYKIILDATAGGSLAIAAVGGSGDTIQELTSARFDYQNFGTVGGQFLSVVNGVDPPLQYNGSAWSVSSMAGSGLTTSNLFTVAVYAERLWYAEVDTFNVWYLPLQSITGTLVKLPLGSLFKLGGSLSNIVTWSADTGSLLADFIAFISTEGEVVVYSGQDPASILTWSRVAQFRIGKPVTRGNRAWCKFGAESVLITADGLIPLSVAVVQDRSDASSAITDKIRNSFNRDVVRHGARYGWSVVLHPIGQKLLVNVPTLEGSTAYQWVMNTQTKAWCRFTAWNAFCFESTRDALYFGGENFLAVADTGLDDNDDVITGDAKQAFSYFGQRGRQKQMTMARPILSIDGPISLVLGIDVDYQDTDPGSVVPIAGNVGDPWEVAWDVAWTGAGVIYAAWNSVRGIGFAIAPRVKVQSSGVNLSWSATDYVYQLGSIL